MRRWYDINDKQPKKGQEVWVTIINIKEVNAEPKVIRKEYRGEQNRIDPYGHQKSESCMEYERRSLDSAAYGNRVIAWMPTDKKPNAYIKRGKSWK